MLDICSNSRVSGFVKADGRRLVNGKGEEILLRGIGIGNWLLPEGYMWRFNTAKNVQRADRPRRIEALIEELAGPAYTKEFFIKFRQLYITEADVKAIAEAGFNSIRIAINYRVLVEEGESLEFIEEGFSCIDNCLSWCEKYKVYAILDLHGAPGGQTGANIDDCIDDMPRLFTDKFQYGKCIILWKEIARRYKDREIVAAYDLLNEPLEPKHADEHRALLIKFYEDLIREIRKIDAVHLLSIEGSNWATDTKIFDRRYDDNMIIHFHRYWCPPEKAQYEEFLVLAEKLDVPLWLGESGENTVEWYGKMFPLAISLGVSYNFWPWKRMFTDKPTTCEITPPEGWEKFIAYIDGGPHPGYKESREILDAFLENIKFENAHLNNEVIEALTAED